MNAVADPLPAPPGLGRRLRERLPEIVIEAASVGAAVLLALGLDEWRDHARAAEQAQDALDGIHAEIAANAIEVQATVDGARRMLAEVEPLAARAAPPAAGEGFALGFEIALTSAAAWNTAQSAGVLPALGFDDGLAIARTYELQRWFEDAQRQAVAGFGRLPGPGTEWSQQRSAFGAVARELRVVVELGEALAREYAAHAGDAP
jgi:hypothetical protein